MEGDLIRVLQGYTHFEADKHDSDIWRSYIQMQASNWKVLPEKTMPESVWEALAMAKMHLAKDETEKFTSCMDRAGKLFETEVPSVHQTAVNRIARTFSLKS